MPSPEALSRADLLAAGLCIGCYRTADEIAAWSRLTREARLALIRSGGASAIVDMDLRALGPLVKVLGGGAGEWAAEGWRERPDFWKEIA